MGKEQEQIMLSGQRMATFNHSASRRVPKPGTLRRLVVQGLGLCLLTGFTPIGAANAPETRENRLKIVFEMASDPDIASEKFVSNVEGLQKDFSNLANISVVASSQGVAMLQAKDNSLESRLAKLADLGVDFMVCSQGLEELEMEVSDLLSFARTVRSGSKEIERLKEQGWACVRDGESYVSHF